MSWNVRVPLGPLVYSKRLGGSPKPPRESDGGPTWLGFLVLFVVIVCCCCGPALNALFGD